MPIALYIDHHIPRAITSGLRLRKIDVLTTREDDTNTLSDPDLLDRAATPEQVLFKLTVFSGPLYHPRREGLPPSVPR